MPKEKGGALVTRGSCASCCQEGRTIPQSLKETGAFCFSLAVSIDHLYESAVKQIQHISYFSLVFSAKAFFFFLQALKADFHFGVVPSMFLLFSDTES